MVRKAGESLAKIASLMGKKGGKSGVGQAKRRGNASYYRDMQRKSVAARLKRAGDGKN